MSRDRISQPRAILSGVVIFLYFVIFTAWLPSVLLKSSFLAGAPRSISDGITVLVWGGFFGFGLLALRWAQDRELI